jgi:hypothetical protein
MKSSATYVALEKMIQHGSLCMALSELVKSLRFFERQGLITTAEQQALLDMATKMNVKYRVVDKKSH